MPIFSYKVKDTAGNTRTGTLEAADERAAAAMIREAGGLPMEIKLSHSAVAVGLHNVSAQSFFGRHVIDPIWTGVSLKALALFFRQLTALLSSGLVLSEALRSVGSRTGGRLKRIIAEMELNTRDGHAMSETMSRYPSVFGSLSISLVRAGEAGGLLEPMVSRIADYLEYEISIRQRLSKIMFYPFLVFAVVILVPHLPLLVLNGFEEFSQSLWASVHQWVYWLIAVVVFVRLLMQFNTSKYLWDTLKMTPPLLGTMARKVAMSRFCKAVAVLYAAGIPISEALRVGAEASANLAVSRAIHSVLPAIRSGAGLTDSLARTHVVMPLVLDMLAVGEKTGNLDPVLIKAAEYMDEEVDATIHKSGIALFVLMILIAGWVVLQMVVTAYTGHVNDAYKEVGK